MSSGLSSPGIPATAPLPTGAATDSSVQAVKDAINAGAAASLPAGTNDIGFTTDKPFQPVPGATKGVTVGTTATAAGSLPLAAAGVFAKGTVKSYRVRNPAASAAPVTWILTTDATKTPTIPVPAAQNGTGGTAGDKTIDPGGVEVFSLSDAQQTALAAGSLFLTAVTASGTATLFITPGNFGA